MSPMVVTFLLKLPSVIPRLPNAFLISHMIFSLLMKLFIKMPCLPNAMLVSYTIIPHTSELPIGTPCLPNPIPLSPLINTLFPEVSTVIPVLIETFSYILANIC